MNNNASGKYFKDAGQIFSKPRGNLGYHLGVFFQLPSFNIALSPKLIYTKTKFNTSLGAVDYQKVNLPVLVKVRFFKVIGFSIGSSFHLFIF
jgi:hypothetical protein